MVTKNINKKAALWRLSEKLNYYNVVVAVTVTGGTIVLVTAFVTVFVTVVVVDFMQMS